MSHAPMRIGFRSSQLGQRLGEQVAEQLRPHLGGTPFTLVPISADAGRGAGAPGAWPGAALEEAVLKGEVDLAVQNAKDLSPVTQPGLVVAAVTERFTPFDVLIARDETIVDELPEGAAIGAHSSLRRAQLLRYRDDLRVIGLRGSLDERIRVLDAGDVDGLVVSASAVEHLGFQDRVTEIFTTEVLVPAPGQGTCAILARQSAREGVRLAKHLDHPLARAAIEAERSFLRELKADPSVGVGALASIDGQTLRLEGIVADRDGHKLVRDAEVGRLGDEEQTGVRLAKRLLLEGARRILAGVGDATH